MFASQSVIDDLIAKLNAETDVPFIGEESEAKAIRWAVEWVAPKIPDYVVQFMDSALDGLSDEEIRDYKVVIVQQANRLLDLPGLPEFVEARIIEYVVDGILRYAQKGFMRP